MRVKLPEHKKFFTVHGRKAETLVDLRDAVATMSDENFAHHLQRGNDFAVWIRDILHQDSLADRIEKVHKREDMFELVEDTLRMERETSINSDEFKRFMVKEFIYGMILGLILGIVITQLL